MPNIKEEFLKVIIGKDLKCATITKGEYYEWDEEDTRIHAHLKQNFTPEDYDKFLNELDFTYDSGFGGQELFGIIWFKDDSWAERGEYDGSEWWAIKELPKIPKELTP